MPPPKGAQQADEDDDAPAAVMDEGGPALHQTNFGFSDHAMRGPRFRNIKADNVSLSEQTLKAFDRLGIAVAKPVGVIVVDNLHAHAFGQGRELRSDITITDNSKRAPP